MCFFELRLVSALLRACLLATMLLLGALPASASIVSDWNKAALAEVRLSRYGPPVVARALAIAHTCMYDAWAAYSDKAAGTVYGTRLRRPAAEASDANKAKAISFAAHRCLVNLFPAGQTRLRDRMISLGYDTSDVSMDLATPQGIGNRVAQGVIDARRYDGSNQYGDLAPGAYSDYTGYVPRNRPLAFCTPVEVSCPPLVIDDPEHWQPLVSDQGVVQRFIAPHWEQVRPFALRSADQFDEWPRFSQPPRIQRDPMFYYRQDVKELLRYSRSLTMEQKLIVEYWADGPASELPAGHWGLFAQFVSERDGHSIDQDVKMFFAMHNASFDAGIVAWHMKRKYDGVRPITAVRYLRQGETVLAWGGPGRPVEAIPGEKWTPYNPGSNLSPSFPGYVSGHSAFSRASAVILRLFTGSSRFGFSTVIPPNFGRVEPGVPAVATTLYYDTFDDAADEAGISRLYAGIHFADDNRKGQQLGRLAALRAWTRANALFHGYSH